MQSPELIWRYGSVIGVVALTLGLVGLWRANPSSALLASIFAFAIASFGLFLGQVVGIHFHLVGDKMLPSQSEWLQRVLYLGNQWLAPAGLLIGGICVACSGWLSRKRPIP